MEQDTDDAVAAGVAPAPPGPLKAISKHAASGVGVGGSSSQHRDADPENSAFPAEDVVTTATAVAPAGEAGRPLTSYSYPPSPRAMDPGTVGVYVAARTSGSWQESVPGHAEVDDWMEEHPSALANFESLLAAAKGKRIVMFLDYDGTLSPIVEDPDRAVMSKEMRDADMPCGVWPGYSPPPL